MVIGGSRRGAKDTPPSTPKQNFFIFMWFLGKMVKYYVATRLGVGAPSLGNPGSTTHGSFYPMNAISLAK